MALSYVWGNEPCAQHLPDQPLQLLPKTIEDSIAVTLELCFQYLWAEMYYIDQDDELNLHDQNLQMNCIYRWAEITIVAIAGNRPKMGLPGVSSKRSKQVHVLLDGIRVGTLLDRPWDEVRKSK